MRPSITCIGFALGIVGLLSCDELDNNPSDPGRNTIDRFLILETDQTSIGVGLSQPVRLTANVTKDATGEDCTFTASIGSFAATSSQASATAKVDVNGQASVSWFAPTVPGSSTFVAQVGDVSGEASIIVTAVPDLTFSGVSDVLTIGQAVQASVQVDPLWAGKTLELRVPDGLLRALGPVEGDFETGTKILPLLDQTGRADFQITAPTSAGTVVLTASLFGTVRSQSIVVQ